MIMVVNLAVGLITPPLGIHLFVAGSLDRSVSLNNLIRACVPFFFVLLLDVILITYVPGISLWILKFLNI
jgi:C4-dicarboxylate transporter DctM subunit